MTEDFRPADRLRTRSDFVRVYEHGLRAHGRLLSVYGVPNDLPRGRLGITASRKVGNAVTRNRAKRRLREIFRTTKLEAQGLDLVVTLRALVVTSPFREVEAEYGALVQRIRRRLRT